MRGKAAMMPSVIPVVWLVIHSALPATPADKDTQGVLITNSAFAVQALLLTSSTGHNGGRCRVLGDQKRRERNARARKKLGRLSLGTRHPHSSKLSTFSTLHLHSNSLRSPRKSWPRPSQYCTANYNINAFSQLVGGESLEIAELRNTIFTRSVATFGADAENTEVSLVCAVFAS